MGCLLKYVLIIGIICKDRSHSIEWNSMWISSPSWILVVSTVVPLGKVVIFSV